MSRAGVAISLIIWAVVIGVALEVVGNTTGNDGLATAGDWLAIPALLVILVGVAILATITIIGR